MPRVLTGLLRALILAPVVLSTVGASVLGLGFVVAYVAGGKELPDDFSVVVQFVFGAAVLVAAFPLYTWWESRRRGWENIGLSAVTALASAGSLLLLRTTTEPLDGVWPSISLMALVAAVVALVEFGFFLLFAKPPPRMSMGERLRTIPPEERWLQARRAIVLEQLSRRELVADADVTPNISLPPDTWRDLESLPDGRVVRRL